MFTKFIAFGGNSKVKLIEETSPALLQHSNQLVKCVIDTVVKVLLLLTQRLTGQCDGLDTLLDAGDFLLKVADRCPHGLPLGLHGVVETVRGVVSVLNVTAGGADSSVAVAAVEP